MMATFTIADDGKSITCLRCGMTSHNPNDVWERYCGRCHRYHTDPSRLLTMRPRPGFDWGRVAWGRPDSPRSAVCSYCFAAIGEDDVPLIMWSADGHAAQFCDACVERWFGFGS